MPFSPRLGNLTLDPDECRPPREMRVAKEARDAIGRSLQGTQLPQHEAFERAPVLDRTLANPVILEVIPDTLVRFELR